MLARWESHWGKKRVSREGKWMKLFCLSDWGKELKFKLPNFFMFCGNT